jgi:hypothetical protein
MDSLQAYLRHSLPGGDSANIGTVSLRGFESFKLNPPEPRETHALANAPRYTDSQGRPYTIGSETTQDRYDRQERQAQVERRNAVNARPVPAATTQLGSGSPQELAAAAAHGAEIAARITAQQAQS